MKIDILTARDLSQTSSIAQEKALDYLCETRINPYICIAIKEKWSSSSVGLEQ